MSPFHLPDVDGVVVNRDGGEALFAAIRSLQAQKDVDVSILVVDNGSQASERERLAKEAPEARVVAFSHNLGFAGAVNEALARTRSSYVLLLNNDAVVSPDYVARLAARLSMDPRLAAVQGLVLTGDGRTVDTAGLTWNARGEALPLLAGTPAASAPGNAFEVSGVSATATLYRRDAIDAVSTAGHAFDGSFFAYYEDVELSLRLWRAGWRFACDPLAIARHEGGRTGGRTPIKRALWICRNRWRTLWRHFDARFLLSQLPRLLAADLAHARTLGWAAPLLPLAIWPRLPFFALSHEGREARLAQWPGVVAPELRTKLAG
ncbi:MAG TPA: glycosyltransferase family 2 protein [Thermoanaerobaculia bacterium]